MEFKQGPACLKPLQWFNSCKIVLSKVVEKNCSSNEDVVGKGSLSRALVGDYNFIL